MPEKRKTWQELEAEEFSKKFPSCLDIIGGERGYKHIWKDAEKQLRKEGYGITLDQFENVFGSFCDLAADLESHKDRVMAVVHEAVEAEEVKKTVGNWVLPRDYYDELLKKGIVEIGPHVIAERIAPAEKRALELARRKG